VLTSCGRSCSYNDRIVAFSGAEEPWYLNSSTSDLLLADIQNVELAGTMRCKMTFDRENIG
jgi:hypothetical protein